MKPFFLILFCTVLFYSCSEKTSISDINPIAKINPLQKPGAYYGQVSGKNLAIWLYFNPVWWQRNVLVDLKDKYGFKYIYVWYDKNESLSDPYYYYHQAIAGGFTNETIIFLIKHHYRPDGMTMWQYIDQLNSMGIKYYYMDESLEAEYSYYHDTFEDEGDKIRTWHSVCDKDTLKLIASYIQQKNVNAKLFVGSYTEFKWIPGLEGIQTTQKFAKDYWDVLNLYNNIWMMNDAYHKTSSIQAQDYQDYFYNYYINYQRKSISHFTDNLHDSGDWEVLLEKANQLGLSDMSFYEGDYGSWYDLKLFCDAAARKGWLIKYQDPPL